MWENVRVLQPTVMNYPPLIGAGTKRMRSLASKVRLTDKFEVSGRKAPRGPERVKLTIFFSVIGGGERWRLRVRGSSASATDGWSASLDALAAALAKLMAARESGDRGVA